MEGSLAIYDNISFFPHCSIDNPLLLNLGKSPKSASVDGWKTRLKQQKLQFHLAKAYTTQRNSWESEIPFDTMTENSSHYLTWPPAWVHQQHRQSHPSQPLICQLTYKKWPWILQWKSKLNITFSLKSNKITKIS